MKRGRLILLVLFLILVSGFTSALEKDCVYYFYGEGCPHCGATGIFLEELQSKYAGLQIHKFEIYYNRTNLKLLQDYLDAYEVPMEKQGVPIVFLPKSYFVGDKPITEYLESAIASNKNLLCPSLVRGEVLGVIGVKSPKHLIETLTFGVVTGAAIVDSINPCAIAVLLILLVLLLMLEKKKKILKGGIAFIAGVSAAYLLLGIGVLGTFTKGHYFHKIIGGLAVILGLTILWYLWKGKVFLREIQEKEKLKKIAKGIAFPITIFLISFILSLFGFSSVRKYFFIISGLIVDEVNRLAAVPLLIYYIILFVLPLVLVTWVIYLSTNEGEKQKEADDQGSKRKSEKNIRTLHLIAGLVMVVLGTVILFLL